MSSKQLVNTADDEFSRCQERRPAIDLGKNLSPSQKSDAAIKESIYQAFWKDNFLRAIGDDEIDVRVKNGVVYLNGHIVNTSSQKRAGDALRDIPGILGVKDMLVLDDKLTLEVSASLGGLEHEYDCKFFTGVSHGVVSLNGVVINEHVKLLAEKRAADNPKTRGVINNVRVSGVELREQGQPFLQPAIGEIIYFIGGVSGVVKQVIINPNNRRVIAMTIQGKFADQQQELKSLNHEDVPSPERLVVLAMSTVRYLTKVSGFLNIHSNERKRYKEFNPRYYVAPTGDWLAPYPYCRDDVLFPVENQEEGSQALLESPQFQFVAASEEQPLTEQLIANDSLGG